MMSNSIIEEEDTVDAQDGSTPVARGDGLSARLKNISVVHDARTSYQQPQNKTTRHPPQSNSIKMGNHQKITPNVKAKDENNRYGSSQEDYDEIEMSAISGGARSQARNSIVASTFSNGNLNHCVGGYFVTLNTPARTQRQSGSVSFQQNNSKLRNNQNGGSNTGSLNQSFAKAPPNFNNKRVSQKATVLQQQPFMLNSTLVRSISPRLITSQQKKQQ